MTADSKSDSKQTFITVPLLSLVAERDFPGDIYLCLNHRMIRYRNKGDKLDTASFNKLAYNRVRYVFIDDNDREAFLAWIAENDKADSMVKAKEAEPEAVEIIDAAQASRRAMMDLFENPKDDKTVRKAVDYSKKLVSEFLRKPFALNNVSALQKYSHGAVDHGVNVSVLVVFLGLRMGYTHQIILENLALGGLFHDIGKLLIETRGDNLTGEDDPAMQQHPKLGAEFLEKQKEITNEVRMIVAQHHEFLDGTGYPTKLRGLAIYDLARLVTIGNVYDNLVSDELAMDTGATLQAAQATALDRLEKEYTEKLDAKKIEKVMKILRYSFV